MMVAIQGYRGSFHHIVAAQLWGTDVQLLERSSFAEIFEDVLKGTVPVGIVAVENTITGSIAETLDLLSAESATIIGELVLPIHQNLLVIPGTKITDLKTIYSHPVAIKQCLAFFKKYPQIELKMSDDTGGSVRTMMEMGDKSVGSIASTLAAELYGAEILAKNIESNHENFTRFLLIAKPPANAEELLATTPLDTETTKNISERKVALILHLKHQPGQLARCLDVIAELGGNIMRIESRPILGKPWEYTIHVDVIVTAPQIIKKLLNKLQPLTEKSDVKGVFVPAAFHPDLVD